MNEQGPARKHQWPGPIGGQSGSYLDRLSALVAAGLARCPPDFCRRHRDYVLGSQRPDGGFAGRQGGTDLYYTAFGLRVLACTGGLDEERTERAAACLAGWVQQPTTAVDWLSLLHAARLVAGVGGPNVMAGWCADWRHRVQAALERLRRPSGGYAKSPQSELGTTYSTFLTVLCYDLMGVEVPGRQELVAFVRSRQRPDGGFSDHAATPRGATNPTAAAVAVLRLLDALDPPTAGAVARFLAGVQNEQGGLRAGPRAPAADLLSTFTGLVTAMELAATLAESGGGQAGRDNAGGQLTLTPPATIDPERLPSFALACELPTGGFAAGPWDRTADIEYTFYGLGTIGLLNLIEARECPAL